MMLSKPMHDQRFSVVVDGHPPPIASAYIEIRENNGLVGSFLRLRSGQALRQRRISLWAAE
jgi:hypothetical protein